MFELYIKMPNISTRLSFSVRYHNPTVNKNSLTLPMFIIREPNVNHRSPTLQIVIYRNDL